MTKPAVRCGCGHYIGKGEVLRTELWERGRGRDTVCVRYRCRRCKRMGEAFVPESDWDWSLLDAPRNEMSPDERDRFADLAPISGSDLLDFHRALDTFDPNAPQTSGARASVDKLAERVRRERDKTGSERRDGADAKPSNPASNHKPDAPPDFRGS